MLNEHDIKKYLKVPLSVRVYDVTESTNKDARALAKSGEFPETLIVSRRQNGGRGRMGRSFFSPDGGLYMSLLLKPDFYAEKAIHLTTAAAVAVARAASKVAGKELDIKWVNDLYFGGRKLCGILTEAEISCDGKLDFAVVGIGVNLTPPVGGFPDDIAHIAGAMFDTLPVDADNILAAEIVNEFYLVYKGGLNACDYIGEYRARSFIIGKEITVSRFDGGESRTAVAEGIDDECRLIVRFADGVRGVLESGEVTIRANGG